MRTDIHIDLFDGIIFLGIFQGLLLAFFFLRNARKKKIAHLYQGLFTLALTLAILEELLNNTGYIVRILAVSNFAEPLNLIFGPLLYLYVKRSLQPSEAGKRDWYHFVPFFIYLFYMGFFFFQPEAVKYNAYLHSKHPTWTMLETHPPFPEDPLGIRSLINPLTALHFGAYLLLTLLLLKRSPLTEKPGNQKSAKQRELRQSTFHFMVIIFIFIATKLYFGRDLGDYFIATYITLMFFLTTFQIMNRSAYFEKTHSFLEVPIPKYRKSSLTEERKQDILARVEEEMATNRYFAGNLASLSGLASRLNESSHHVSQVINEKMNGSFFEILASYRIHEAKKLLVEKGHSTPTIEEVAEQVGYNSKSAFNKAFKKLTGSTPSEYRRRYTSS
jgi:AraC-like DNA-binding protein